MRQAFITNQGTVCDDMESALVAEAAESTFTMFDNDGKVVDCLTDATAVWCPDEQALDEFKIYFYTARAYYKLWDDDIRAAVGLNLYNGITKKWAFTFPVETVVNVSRVITYDY